MVAKGRQRWAGKHRQRRTAGSERAGSAARVIGSFIARGILVVILAIPGILVVAFGIAAAAH
jgi:hypothetical protein